MKMILVIAIISVFVTLCLVTGIIGELKDSPRLISIGFLSAVALSLIVNILFLILVLQGASQ